MEGNIKMRFKSNNQRKAVMAKLKGIYATKMATRKVLAYSSEIAKKVFRDQNEGLVPIGAKMVGTKQGRKVYEVSYRKRK